MKIAQFQVPGGELPAPSGLDHLDGGLSTSGQGAIQLGINLLFMFATFVAVVYLMYAGIRFITAGGDPEKVADAKRKMFFAIIGIVVVAGAFFIVRIVVGLLGGDQSTNIFTPSVLLDR